MLHYGNKVSVGWFRFISIVKALAQNEQRISLGEAQSITRECGIKNSTEFIDLMQKMNGLGFISGITPTGRESL